MLKLGIIADVITIIVMIAAMLICVPGFLEARDSRNDAREITQEITKKNELLLEETERLSSMGIYRTTELITYNEADKADAKADAAEQTVIASCAIFFVVMLAHLVIFIVVCKKKYPYYSDGVFFYLLFGRDKKGL